MNLLPWLYHNEWVLPYRSELLTTLFKLFIHLAADYFFIIVSAAGYWLYSKKKLFVHLGFLIPFSTLINCLLKNFFRIPRPDQALHLVTVSDPFGFPSGDMQVGTLFWLSIFYTQKNAKWRYLCFIPILGIGLSRIYLAVHTIRDVIGALGISILMAKIWQSPSIHNHISNWYKDSDGGKQKVVFWIIVISSSLLYALFSYGIAWPSLVFKSIGALVGYGFSFPSIKSFLQKKEKRDKVHFLTELALTILSFLSLMGLYKIIPTFPSYPISYILKYTLIIYNLYTFLPWLKKQVY